MDIKIKKQKIFITIEFNNDYDLFIGKVLREDGYLLYKRFADGVDSCLKELGFSNPENNLNKLQSIIYSEYEILYFDKEKYKNWRGKDSVAIEYYLAVIRQSLRSGVNKIEKDKNIEKDKVDS